MDKIPSFQKNHDILQPGFHFSGAQKGVDTFDLRFKRPNAGDFISPKALHSVEHMLATALRNGKCKDSVLYFGPMGCRTGNYLILSGDYASRDILPLVTGMFEFIRDFEGEIPGAAAKDCGNYLDQNLGMAKWQAKKYLDTCLYCIREENLVYPE